MDLVYHTVNVTVDVIWEEGKDLSVKLTRNTESEGLAYTKHRHMIGRRSHAITPFAKSGSPCYLSKPISKY